MKQLILCAIAASTEMYVYVKYPTRAKTNRLQKTTFARQLCQTTPTWQTHNTHNPLLLSVSRNVRGL